MINKKIDILFLISLLLLTNCSQITITKAGVFKKPYKYSTFPFKMVSKIEIDGKEITFFPLGFCETTVNFLAIILPIPLFPIGFNKNTCKNKGFIVSTTGSYLEERSKINYQLKYNDKIYNPISNGFNNFNISDFELFKKAKDKTLIIHKKRDDGTVVTKEIPFEWKFVIYF